MDILWSWATELGDDLFSAGSRLYPVYMVSSLVIGLAIYAIRRPQKNFISWAFPKEVYAHPSHFTDIKLLFVGSLLRVAGVLNVTILNAIVVYYTLETFGRGEAVITPFTPFIVGFIFLVAGDFCTYWVHRIHHEWKVVWPFHAVHHSAEVMSPITVYRKHPFYDLFAQTFRALLFGCVQGVILSLFVGKIPVFLIAGTSAFYFVFNMIGSNFRHSHIWFSYGRVLEHLFISPAQHQIHHSLAYKHWNKNYGEVFALWDWVFGTLYIPNKQEELAFGLSDVHGTRIEQPYPNLTEALCKPVMESWAEILGIDSQKSLRGGTEVESQ